MRVQYKIEVTRKQTVVLKDSFSNTDALNVAVDTQIGLNPKGYRFKLKTLVNELTVYDTGSKILSPETLKKELILAVLKVGEATNDSE